MLMSSLLTSDRAAELRSSWQLAEGVCYLNHGSFGPSPLPVREARQRWTDTLERNPMDFFLRQYETELAKAAECLARFVGANPRELAFVDNATFAMNIVAAQVDLGAGDEILLTDHEYGAVRKIWQHRCDAAGAKVTTAKLPDPLVDQHAIVEAVFAAVTPQTKLIVVSHVTSPTAVILPVQAICQRARKQGIRVCIDGPHAVAMLDVNLRDIGCDYYAASCHKWLSAPFGSGFLYIAARHAQKVQPPVRSWGGKVNGQPFEWQDEFHWIGTRDPAAFLSVPTAIEFLESVGLDTFRKHTHEMARIARERITEFTQLEPITPDAPEWYGPMVTLPLPPLPDGVPGSFQRDPLQDALWERERIEIPLVHWNARRFIRVSCHLYNSMADIDRLLTALARHLPEFT